MVRVCFIILPIIGMKDLQDLQNCFDEIIKLCKKEDFYLEMFTKEIDNLLDDLYGQDAFGTEWQNDPRWDHRNDWVWIE